MKTVFLGLGSNLEQPILQIQEAVDRIRDIPGVTVQKLSSMYRSPPMGPQEQPDFVNAVAVIETNLSAKELLVFLQRIEDTQERDRSVERWGPRTIDLDILLFGDESVETAELTIPHKGVKQRPFFVYPIAEIAENLVFPDGENIIDVKSRCPMAGLQVIKVSSSKETQ